MPNLKPKRFVLKSRHIISAFVLTELLAGAVLLWSQTQHAPGSRFFVSTNDHDSIGMAAKLVMNSMSLRARPPIGREFPTSAPGVTYVLRSNGDVEFHAAPGFRGVAITPDGRNLYLAN